jgi:hypothetical protein
MLNYQRVVIEVMFARLAIVWGPHFVPFGDGSYRNHEKGDFQDGLSLVL